MKATRAAFVLVALFLFPGCPGKSPKGSFQRVSENWLVSYVDTTRIGYSVTRQYRVPGGYRFEGMMKMSVEMAGVRQDVHYSSEILTAADYALRSFEFSFRSREREFDVIGVVEGKSLRVMGQGDQPRTFPLRGPVYPMAALGPIVMSRRPGPDSVYKFEVFDVSVMSVVPVQVTVLGREKVKVGDEEMEGLRVKTRLAQVEMTSWFDPEGLPILEMSPPRMRSERTTAARAMAEEQGQARLDLLRMFRVPVDTLVPEPTGVTWARLEITGVRADELPFAADSQKIVNREPLEVEIAVPAPPDRCSLPVSGQAEFLKPTLSVQSDHPEVRAKALEVVGKVSDAVAAARSLVSWVFAAMDKTPTASFPTALDVLRHMKGDCNEHAVFYAALARSLGIPTKVAVGLVYMDGAFYYHAWNEVFLGGWVPVDATFGEFPAGALRLKLSEGELSEQTQVLNVVGRIGIKIKEWRSSGRSSEK